MSIDSSVYSFMPTLDIYTYLYTELKGTEIKVIACLV